jgi:DNA mismatch repair ATPase MutS
MHRERDFDPREGLPWQLEALMQDLELDTLFGAMALGDTFLYEIARQAALTGLDHPEAILYRQAILKDCLKNPEVVREIYRIPLDSARTKQKHWLGIFSSNPSGILSNALALMRMLVGQLKKLRTIADAHAHQFESTGFARFFAMIQSELDDDYFAVVQKHLQQLEFRRGVLLSAQLGPGNEGSGYELRKPKATEASWLRQLSTRQSRTYSFKVDPYDQYGSRTLGELTDEGVNLVANALAQSADHIDGFLSMLGIELAFYIGCMNLAEQLASIREPTAFPQPLSSSDRTHSFSGLYDVCLALTMKRKVVGNDVIADGKSLVIITGANQGGKSTFLRAVGLAQLMLQCGMFVPATSFSANLCQGIFTHYRREEDTTMTSGKLDEELGRMSQIVERIRPNSMILFNESFAATNEREGSEIARQIVGALLQRQVKVFFVTHLYAFAHGMHEQKAEQALFLRADRKADGRRTFKLVVAEPLQTSFGADLYNRIFEPPSDSGSQNPIHASPTTGPGDIAHTDHPGSG